MTAAAPPPTPPEPPEPITGPSPPEKVGVFGGTFDPPHIGHLAAAEAARVELGLHRVLFVVSNVPWQKADGYAVSDAADRLAMVRAAVGGLEDFEASTLEIERGGDSFTAETLEQLSTPGRRLYLILGSDLAPSLDSWKRPAVIRSLATVAVVGRLGDAGDAVPPPGWDWVGVPGPGLEVSSSDIRHWLEEGRPLGAVLTTPVVEEIRRRSLYGS